MHACVVSSQLFSYHLYKSEKLGCIRTNQFPLINNIKKQRELTIVLVSLEGHGKIKGRSENETSVKAVFSQGQLSRAQLNKDLLREQSF